MDTNRIIVIANTPSPYNDTSRVLSANGICSTLAARDYKGLKKLQLKTQQKKVI